MGYKEYKKKLKKNIKNIELINVYILDRIVQETLEQVNKK